MSSKASHVRNLRFTSLLEVPLRLGVLAAMFAAAAQAVGEEPGVWYKEHEQELLEVYRDFHSHPELSFHERETAARLAEHWRHAGYEVTTDVGGHGVVGLLKNGDGPCVMLRTDLDALPVTEETGLAFASQVRVEQDGGEVGVMHACGHDVHITNLVAAARYLAEHRDAWKGTLLLIGQPAEERGAGAAAMLADGLFERFPKPDFAVALHVDSTLAAGRVGVRPGYSLANVDSVDITFHGRGGHGAHPDTTIDPIVMAAQFIVSLQAVVAREIKPIEPAVITVGSIHGGTKHNIIPDDCALQLTVRSYSDEVRAKLRASLERRAKAAALAAGAPEPEIRFSEGTPALANDAALTERLAGVFRGELGAERVVDSEPSMGGEDFSHFGRAGVPILMFRLGAVEEKRLARYEELGQTPPSLHSPEFYPDVDLALPVGVRCTCAAVLELLRP